MPFCVGSRPWPELLGKPGTEAKAIIEGRRPGCKVHVIREGSSVTHDYRTNRVRVYVDKDGIVKCVKIG